MAGWSLKNLDSVLEATSIPQNLSTVKLPIRFFLCVLYLTFNTVALALKPVVLTCEYQRNPLNIDVSSPRFSWQFLLEGKNQLQRAYQITVREQVNNQFNVVWNSGKVESTNNILVPYNGKPLKSHTRYYWQVKAYNQTNDSAAWSEEAWFETAKLKASDWVASWIGDGSKQFTKDEDFYQDDRMPLFRRNFSIKKKLMTARLYISGLGYYEAYLNGKKVSGNILDPGWTAYGKEVLYVVHDVTKLLKQGENNAGIMLGNGWYNPLPIRLFSRFNLRDFQETGRPKVIGEIHLQYSDGSNEIIKTDDKWLTSLGPIVRNNVYLGEHYDARLEQADWLTSKYKSSNWKNATVTDAPTGKLSAQMQPPIRVTQIIKPIEIKENKPGVFLVDFGQNFAGVVRLKVKGAVGTQIKIKYGEAIHADGSLNYLTTVAGQIKEIWNLKGGPGAPPTAWQEDRYTLKGNAIETWAPRFTFHGFRFIEVTGWPGKPDLNAFEGLRMNSDLESAGEFACSNEMFNQLHEATQWTFLSNVFSVQSDCPGREKMSYGADIVVTANSYMYNYQMSNFYKKTIADYKNDQQADGGITEIAPYTGIAERGYGGQSGPLGWQLAFPYLQKQLYQFYGDIQIIETNYEAVKKQIAFLEAHAINGLFHWDISDHVAIDPRPEAFTAACFYYHHALLAEEFASILNKKDDEANFKRLANQIKSRIVEKYLVPGTGRFDNATQSAQLFALWYQLSPEPEKTLQVLMSEFERHRQHVSSGIFGVMMMFDVLRELNLNEQAYAIANQKEYPGWGFMLSKGATTLWESWEYPDNAPSQNHPMFGSTEEWFYRTLLGINPAAPGFEKIIIKPQPAGDLTWAKGSYESVRGKIESDWRIEKGMFNIRVNIPANTQAEIWIKNKQGGLLRSGNQLVTPLRFSQGYAIVNVTSGEFEFQSEL